MQQGECARCGRKVTSDENYLKAQLWASTAVFHWLCFVALMKEQSATGGGRRHVEGEQGHAKSINKCSVSGLLSPTRSAKGERVMSLNKVMVIGHLGQDPEIRYTPTDLPVVNFSVATDEAYLDKEGKRQERAEWHRIVVIGKLALTCNEYLKKGRQIYVEGGGCAHGSGRATA